MTHFESNDLLTCAVCDEPIPGPDVTRIVNVGWAHKECNHATTHPHL